MTSMINDINEATQLTNQAATGTLTDTQRASIAYFLEIEPAAFGTPTGKNCPWLLVGGETRQELAAPPGAWTKVWEGGRPGERKEKFRLFRHQVP